MFLDFDFVFVPEVLESVSLSHGLLLQTGNYLTLIFGLAGNQKNRQSLSWHIQAASLKTKGEQRTIEKPHDALYRAYTQLQKTKHLMPKAKLKTSHQILQSVFCFKLKCIPQKSSLCNWRGPIILWNVVWSVCVGTRHLHPSTVILVCGHQIGETMSRKTPRKKSSTQQENDKYHAGSHCTYFTGSSVLSVSITEWNSV